MTLQTPLKLIASAAFIGAMGASAFASDAASQFEISKSSDPNIRVAATAFKKGDFEKSITFSNLALKTSLSDRREAIVQSNLCAAYGATGDMSKAAEACDKALDLRPGYGPAEANKAALTIMLAEK